MHPSHNKETAADKVTLFLLVVFFCVRVNLLKVKVIQAFALPASDLVFLQKGSPHKCHKELSINIIIKPHKKIQCQWKQCFLTHLLLLVVCWFGRHFANSLGFILSDWDLDLGRGELMGIKKVFMFDPAFVRWVWESSEELL